MVRVTERVKGNNRSVSVGLNDDCSIEGGAVAVVGSTTVNNAIVKGRIQGSSSNNDDAEHRSMDVFCSFNPFSLIVPSKVQTIWVSRSTTL